MAAKFGSGRPNFLACLILVLLASSNDGSNAFILPTSQSQSKKSTSSSLTHKQPWIPRETAAYSSISGNVASGSKQQQELPYDWQNQWYAVTYASYIPNPSQSAETVPASVFGQPLVLWRSEDDGLISCADDICPHRAAALSEGRVRDGKLECYYHGWQFQGHTSNTTDDAAKVGSCTFIPQLFKNATGPPKQACLKMRECRVAEGIVWVWMGNTTNNIPDPPRQNDGLDDATGKRKGWIVNDFQIDLPYDHSYLVENLIDPAHIPISHDRTPGGGRRENAQAYDMIVDADSVSSTGFTGRYRTEAQMKNNDPYIEVIYEAPGIIRQKGKPRGQDSPITFGAALHCMPLSLGRSRLLFRAYFGGLPPILTLTLKLKPAFLRNLNSCKVLEQDVGLITTQEDHFARNRDRHLRDDFLLLQSTDTFVKAYRQWLDKVGHGMPWFQGLASKSNNVDQHLTGFDTPPALDPFHHRASNVEETRYHRHVMHCPTTRNALYRIQWIKKAMITVAVAAITAAAAGGSGVAVTNGGSIANKLNCLRKLLVPIIPLSCLASALLHKLEQRFFVSFKRKEQMRTEKGI